MAWGNSGNILNQPHSMSSSSAATFIEDGTAQQKVFTSEETPPKLLFARQVTTNECAAQAKMLFLLNVDEEPFAIDEHKNDSAIDYHTQIVLGSILTDPFLSEDSQNRVVPNEEKRMFSTLG
eukprot:12248532-Ditylum_brightwellii.AAC.1